MKEALFYQKLEKQKVQCKLCPHQCIISPGETGICGVRMNRDGILFSLVYDKIIATHVDPIEKKPLFHVAPGSKSFSIATVGCNFRCEFCQNSDISQYPRLSPGKIPGNPVSPKEIINQAIQTGCRSIAYTYTEPTIYFELAYQSARLAHEAGLLNVFVTNGYINAEPLQMIQPYLDAANVDLKAFDEKFYKKIVGGKFSAVLDTLRLLKKLNIFIEITTLLIPTLNDDEVQLRELTQFIKNELGIETPWHISRFYPQYNMTHLPPTPVKAIQRAREIGLEAGLRYVYTGNIGGEAGEHTYCYNCHTLLIQRYGFQISKYEIREGRCPKCSSIIDGIAL
ncbi:AmmeMemoRadiSam system radical SAM enzyme [candidate division KSB1 bacterium]|nr:AmmeMemoRadiSam system radical SAM enzyme [candidate division KSB1 bacterium]